MYSLRVIFRITINDYLSSRVRDLKYSDVFFYELSFLFTRHSRCGVRGLSIVAILKTVLKPTFMDAMMIHVRRHCVRMIKQAILSFYPRKAKKKIQNENNKNDFDEDSDDDLPEWVKKLSNQVKNTQDSDENEKEFEEPETSASKSNDKQTPPNSEDIPAETDTLDGGTHSPPNNEDIEAETETLDGGSHSPPKNDKTARKQTLSNAWKETANTASSASTPNTPSECKKRRLKRYNSGFDKKENKWVRSCDGRNAILAKIKSTTNLIIDDPKKDDVTLSIILTDVEKFEDAFNTYPQGIQDVNQIPADKVSIYLR